MALLELRAHVGGARHLLFNDVDQGPGAGHCERLDLLSLSTEAASRLGRSVGSGTGCHLRQDLCTFEHTRESRCGAPHMLSQSIFSVRRRYQPVERQMRLFSIACRRAMASSRCAIASSLCAASSLDW